HRTKLIPNTNIAQAGNAPLKSGLTSTAEQLSSMKNQKARVRPLIPPNICDEFQIGETDSTRDAVATTKLSSSQRVYLPISGIRLLPTDPQRPAILQLDGRLQWLTLAEAWEY